MVASLARQSIVLKCIRQKSVLVGNYEFYYVSGLMKKLYGLEVTPETEPEAMMALIQDKLPKITAANDQESWMLHMVSIYEPLDVHDEQTKNLFRWGEREEDLWKVTTGHREEEYTE